MLVPALIFFACFGVGLTAAASWLPGLAAGPVGGIAFFAVCGLLGAALGEVGLNTYSIIKEMSRSLPGLAHAEILADGLRVILLDAGTLFGLALIVYLLAPAGDEEAVEGVQAVPQAER